MRFGGSARDRPGERAGGAGRQQGAGGAAPRTTARQPTARAHVAVDGSVTEREVRALIDRVRLAHAGDARGAAYDEAAGWLAGEGPSGPPSSRLGEGQLAGQLPGSAPPSPPPRAASARPRGRAPPPDLYGPDVDRHRGGQDRAASGGDDRGDGSGGDGSGGDDDLEARERRLAEHTDALERQMAQVRRQRAALQLQRRERELQDRAAAAVAAEQKRYEKVAEKRIVQLRRDLDAHVSAAEADRAALVQKIARAKRDYDAVGSALEELKTQFEHACDAAEAQARDATAARRSEAEAAIRATLHQEALDLGFRMTPKSPAAAPAAQSPGRRRA
ncbi:hypothetical protein M885DRAFT_592385 [Pelagophyceae sp. CCMP2097]|nr:hypothetical protein M885DRAFT_592385 [Pelagophyceae sp. CCMP2097]